MNKPVLMIVDDDPQVLAAVRRDLRSRYRENYTVISAASGQEALDTARELKSRGDALAMVISDQRMPGMLGSEVLEMTPNMAFLAPPNSQTVHSVVNLMKDKTQAWLYIGHWIWKQGPRAERPSVKPEPLKAPN